MYLQQHQSVQTWAVRSIAVAILTAGGAVIEGGPDGGTAQGTPGSEYRVLATA